MKELEPKSEGYPYLGHLAPMGGLIGLSKAIKQLKIGVIIATIIIVITIAIIVATTYGHPD